MRSDLKTGLLPDPPKQVCANVDIEMCALEFYYARRFRSDSAIIYKEARQTIGEQEYLASPSYVSTFY